MIGSIIAGAFFTLVVMLVVFVNWPNDDDDDWGAFT